MKRTRLSVVSVGLVGFVAAGVAPVFGQGANDCASAQAIAGDGIFDFNNTTATKDGVTDCGLLSFERDVWFAWTANFAGTATLQTCGLTAVITKIAAYDLRACPPSPHLACNNNACGNQSLISWPVASGTIYLIRIGGFGGDQGIGTFTIATPPILGGCCMPDGSCMELTVDDCASNTGTYQGADTTCAGTCLMLSRGFTYQGQLKLDGVPLNNSADFEFTLWDADTAGNMIGAMVAIANVTVVNGLFTVEVNANGEFGPNAFNGAARWLEIAVSIREDSGAPEFSTPGFTTLMPRQPMTATPYATFAQTAQTAQNLADTVFVNAGNVGIGTTSPGAELQVVDTDNLPFADIAQFLANNLHQGIGIGPNRIEAIGSNTDQDILLLAKGAGRLQVGDLDVVGSEGMMRFASRSSIPGSAVRRTWEIGVPQTADDRNGAGYSFVIDDTQLGTDPEFIVKFGTGRVGIGRIPSHPLHVGTDSTNGNGAHVTIGGIWTNGSDRNSKKNFAPIDANDILSKVAKLPITRWQYKGEPDTVKHIGPMAQDFRAAFGLGASDEHIGTLDADGVALAAIQGLYEIVREKDAEIAELKTRLERMEAMVAKLAAGLGARPRDLLP